MRFFATAARGTEGALRDELRALRLPRVRADRGGVHFEGELPDGMRACLHSRIAMRVLQELATFDAGSEQALYDGVRAIDWSEHLTPRHTLAVSATCRSSALTHSQYIALKTKDGVVDQLRDTAGARPDVSPRDPDVSIVVRLVKDVATLHLDLAGEPLHRRGYRTATVEAVMKETLAAAVLALAGWPSEMPLIDPLCGAGTIPIEAAMIARGIAPGLRRPFGFERWPVFDGPMLRRWSDMLDEARAAVRPNLADPIVAMDISQPALDATVHNARGVGVERDVVTRRGDARALRAERPTWVVADPPYGDRLASKPLQLAGFYRQMGEAFRTMRGSTVALISGTPLLGKSIPLTPDMEHTLFNGDIECRLLRYRIDP